jgi:hypothetical protein
MNFYLISFIAAGIMITGIGSFKLSDQMITAIIFFIGSLILFIVYGIRWFGSTSVLTIAPGKWPPVINTCPDYLTYYKRTVGGINKDTCIDTIGVSKDNSLLAKFPSSGTPSDDKYYLDLSGVSSDPTTKSTQLCNKALNMKVTWEGVTNGESCVTRRTSSSGAAGAAGAGTASAAGAAGAGCPA